MPEYLASYRKGGTLRLSAQTREHALDHYSRELSLGGIDLSTVREVAPVSLSAGAIPALDDHDRPDPDDDPTCGAPAGNHGAATPTVPEPADLRYGDGWRL